MINKIICIVLLLNTVLITNKINARTSRRQDEAPTVEHQHSEDTRKVKNISSPNVLNAVGKLSSGELRARVRRKINCTANLIAPINNIGSNIIVTAKHCIDKDVKKYLWTTIDNNGEQLRKRAKIIYQDDKFDWAMLSFNKAIDYSSVNPLIVNTENVHNLNLYSKKMSDYLVAGFSVDNLGNFGKKLTYEDNPKFVNVITDEKSDNHIGNIGAITYQGDSGGAVILTNENSNYLVGIMSYIKSDKKLFKNTKGVFGNVTGYFTSLVGYQDFLSTFTKYFSLRNLI